MKKNTFPSVFGTWIVCFLFWLTITGQIVGIFTGNLSVETLIAGVVVCLVVALFSARFFIHENAFFFFHPARLGKLIIYCLIIFPIELVKANLDVAFKALSPKMKINPGIVKIPFNISSEYGRAMLANSITLTPGTITIDFCEDLEDNNQPYFYIHWLNVQSTDWKEAGEMIKGSLEKPIRGIWE